VASLGAEGPVLYSFSAAFPEHPYPRLANADDAADLVVDVRSVADRVEAATRCHVSQHALFVRRRSEAEGRRVDLREIIYPAESLKRHWPSGPAPADPLPDWLGEQARPNPRPGLQP
jgi:hypothetical protein